MNKLFAATAFAIALGFAAPAMAASETDCQARWDKAGVSKSGILEGKAVAPYLKAIKESGKKYDLSTANQLNAVEFMAVCRDDTFKKVAASL